MVVKRHGRQRRRSTKSEFVVCRSCWYLPSVETAQGTSLAVSVHLGTSLYYVDQVPKCPKVVPLGLDHVSSRRRRASQLFSIGRRDGFVRIYTNL
jgi:hypothetical protein